MFKRFLHSATGNAGTLFAIAAIPILGAAGVAIDYVRQDRARTELQAAADAASLAGVSADINHALQAERFFDSNFNAENFETVSRTCSKTGDIVVSCDASGKIKASLTSLMGFGDLEFGVTATAVRNAGASASSPCIMTLAPNTSQSFLVNSGADVEAEDCEIHVKSTANPAAIFNSGTTIDSDKICIEGSQIIDNGGTHPNLQKPCTTKPNPFAGLLPEPPSSSCDYNSGTYSGNTTLNPGVYCGWHNFNSGSNVTLRSGLYVIKDGGWNANGGNWTGTGVTFYFADTSKIQFNSAVQATLSAPTSGTYSGFLFAEKEGLSSSQFIFDDSRGFDMEGKVYLPSREVVFNSNHSMRTRKMTVVSRTMILNNVQWRLESYMADDDGDDAEVRLTE